MLQRILYVDDEDALVTMAKIILEMEGYAVCTASNGEAGLQLIASEKPDLVITDLDMPVMGGIEMIRQTRSVNVYLPFVAVSADFTGPRKGVLQQLRVNQLVAKPFSRDALLEAVKQAHLESLIHE